MSKEEIYYEFRLQPHEKWLEGSCDSYKPDNEEIKKECLKRGYKVSDLDVFYDSMFQCWRFSGDLEQIKKVSND